MCPVDTNTSAEPDRLKRPLLTRETDSADGTLSLARALGALLRPGDWVALVGDLGTGKTLFTQGVGEALKCRGPVRSPTFVLVQTYKPHAASGVSLNHVDLYRLAPSEIPGLDWEYLLCDSAVTVVEWAEKAVNLWPPAYLAVRISHLDLARRRLEFFAMGERSVALVNKLKRVNRGEKG